MIQNRGICTIALLFLIISCGGSNAEKSKVTIGFDSSKVKAENGVDVSKVSAIPSNVASVDINVFNGNGSKSYYSKSFSIMDISDSSSVTIEVASGADRVIKVVGRDSSGVARYSVSSDPIDLREGESVDVFLVMKAVQQDAVVPVKLVVEEGGGADYSVPAYAASAIKAEVYIPSAIDGKLTMGSALSGSYSGSSTSFNLNAYPDTYQIIMVRAMTKDADVLAPDGVIAAIGSVIVSKLNSGTNPRISIRMVKPGRLSVTTGSEITSYSVSETINGSDYVVSSATGLSGIGKTILLTVPNGVPIWGSAYDADTNPDGVKAISRTIKISINGGSAVQYTCDGVSYPYLLWKQLDLNY